MGFQDDYRAYVGRREGYDILAANQFLVLANCGLCEHHRVLDFGCGSLRLGRLLIPFLLPEGYHAIDPERALVEKGLECELGWDAVRIKRPRFLFSRDFPLHEFGTRFDFVIAHSIFTHTGHDLAVEMLRAIRAVLAPGGVLLATVIEGAPEADQPDFGWSYPRCVSWPRSTIANWFRRAGLSGGPINQPHPCQSWWAARRSSE
jgi:SAM-dependent methyltransferase